MMRSSARLPPEAKRRCSRDDVTWTYAMHARRSSDYGILEGAAHTVAMGGRRGGNETRGSSLRTAKRQRRGIGGRLGPVVFYTTYRTAGLAATTQEAGGVLVVSYA